jgi:hypothetical protein
VPACPYIGLAPSLANVYQVNIPVPSSASAGLNPFEITGPDSDNIQVAIPVGSSVASSLDVPAVAPQAVRRHSVKRYAPKSAPCFAGGLKGCSAAGSGGVSQQ